MKTENFEVFKITQTPKDGALQERKKSLGKFTEIPAALEAVEKQRAKGVPLLRIVDSLRGQEITFKKVRNNYRISTREFTPEKSKKNTK